MPNPPKMSRLNVDEMIRNGGRQQFSRQHVGKHTKNETVPLKQRVLEVMQSTSENTGFDFERNSEPKVRETYTQNKSQNLFDNFIDAFKTAYSSYDLDGEFEIKNVISGIQKRLQIDFDTRRCIIRSLVVDNGSTLNISMTSSIRGNKQAMKEVESDMKRHYHNIKNIQIESMKLVGLTMNLSFSVKKDQNIIEDLMLILKPFI